MNRWICIFEPRQGLGGRKTIMVKVGPRKVVWSEFEDLIVIGMQNGWLRSCIWKVLVGLRRMLVVNSVEYPK